MRRNAEFDLATGQLLFDVTIMMEEPTERLTFFFAASEDTKQNFDLYNEGIIRVTCDKEKMPRVFVIPSHDPKFKRELTVYIHDYIANFNPDSELKN